jgi:hypothetical protein
MAQLEPLEPTSVRHILDRGRLNRAGETMVHNHVDYRFGNQLNALWARAQTGQMNKVILHNSEHHDLDSDHMARVLMYLYARFEQVELFDPNVEDRCLPMPRLLRERVRDLLDDYFAGRDLKAPGWDEPDHAWKH